MRRWALPPRAAIAYALPFNQKCCKLRGSLVHYETKFTFSCRRLYSKHLIAGSINLLKPQTQWISFDHLHSVSRPTGNSMSRVNTHVPYSYSRMWSSWSMQVIDIDCLRVIAVWDSYSSNIPWFCKGIYYQRHQSTVHLTLVFSVHFSHLCPAQALTAPHTHLNKCTIP